MEEITQLDITGLSLIKQFEGCRLSAYRDSAGIPTIGYGQTFYPSTGKRVTMQDQPITQSQADSMFLSILKPFCLGVYSVSRDDLKQNEFNALVSLTYNIGTAGYKGSTVHRLSDQHITGQPLYDAWTAWDKVTKNGVHVVDDGLLKRRIAEYNLYMTGINQTV